MSDLLARNLPPNENRAPQLYAALWSSVPILTAIVAARFWVRIRMRSVGLDDYLMLSGFIVYIACNALGTVYVKEGGAKHVSYIQPAEQLTKVLRLATIAQPFGVVACALFWQKWFLYFCLAVLIALSIGDIALKFAQCSPVRAVWDVSILPSEKSCWSPSVSTSMSLANASWNTFMDFVLALIPITIIWKLNLDIKTKIGLAAFLGLGVFAGIASALKTDQLNLLSNRADFTWGVYDMYIWNCVEFSLVIVCGCIPPIKPIFDFFHKNKPITPSGSGWSKHNASHRSTMKDTSTNRTTMTTASDAEELVGRHKNGQIMVSRQYDIESQSIPSRDSAGFSENGATMHSH